MIFAKIKSKNYEIIVFFYDKKRYGRFPYKEGIIIGCSLLYLSCRATSYHLARINIRLGMRAALSFGANYGFWHWFVRQI